MLDAKEFSSKSEHNLILKVRKSLFASGIVEILNFDERNINVKTMCGELCIEGENMRINVLDVEKGELEINGKIYGVNYLDVSESDKKSLLAKIFK